MKRILFVCHGNICRSPAAEGIFKKKVHEHGLEAEFLIDSAGTHGYHEGDLPDYRMRDHASQRGYQLTSRSRPIKKADFGKFDLIIGMDDNNLYNLKRVAPDRESQQKIRLMTDYCLNYMNNNVPDPYYGGPSGFENVLDLLEDACEGLLDALKNNRDK